MDLRGKLGMVRKGCVHTLHRLLTIWLGLHCCWGQRLRGSRARPAVLARTLRVPVSVSLSIYITEGWVSGASDPEFWVIVESMDLNRQGCYGEH